MRYRQETRARAVMLDLLGVDRFLLAIVVAADHIGSRHLAIGLLGLGVCRLHQTQWQTF